MISPHEPTGGNPAPDLSDPLVQKGLERLAHYLDYAEKAEQMSDAQLIDAVIERVWGQMAWNEPEALLNELMKRFEQRAGITRDENGEIIS